MTTRLLSAPLVLLLAASAALATPKARVETLEEIREGHTDQWFSHTDGHPDALPDKNLGNEIFYQIFVDRFRNGNPANDCVAGGRFCDPARNDWYRYWGGDLRGVIDALPYLKELGVTRIWLTPIFENALVTVRRHRHGRDVEVTSYHGYWIRDWFKLNPYFTDGGKDDFAIVSELVEAAQPEIRLILDSVANHTSPSDATTWSLQWNAEREPLREGRDHRGALFENGHYVAGMTEDERRASEPGYRRHFHPFGSITDWNDPFQVQFFQLDGLSDLDQEHPVIRDYLERAHDFWLAAFPGLAGYRMDTIKHVSHSYWQDFDRALYLRHPETEIVGEYFSGGPWEPASARYYRETRQSMFDFSFRYAATDVFLGEASMGRFLDLWRADGALIDARPLVTFLDNHDIPRLRGMGMTYPRLRQALALMFAARGIPCIYYGLEQDLFHPGDPGDPYNRPMMTRFDREHELYSLIKTLSALRKENLALRYGATHVVHQTRHILAFERVLGDERVFFAASKNPIPGSDDFTMRNLTLPDGLYEDLLSGRVYRVERGQVPVSLRDGDVIVLSSTRRR